MRLKVKLMIVFGLGCMLLVMAGCKNLREIVDPAKEEPAVIEGMQPTDTRQKIYYLAEDMLGIEGEDYRFTLTENVIDVVNECLLRLQSAPNTDGLLQTLGTDLKVSAEYQEDIKQVNVYFNNKYYDMESTTEILVRAAVVLTLTQFETVIDYVQFFIDGEALTEKDGSTMIMMKSNFVEDTKADVKHLNEEKLLLFFATSDGKLLYEQEYSVHYLKTAKVEQVVIEGLISGPLSRNLKPVLSPGTKFAITQMEDGIIEVDFNQKFYEVMNEQELKINIYSVVNSLCRLEHIEKVQIKINGDIITEPLGGIDISGPLKGIYDETLVFQVTDSPITIEETEILSDESDSNDESE